MDGEWHHSDRRAMMSPECCSEKSVYNLKRSSLSANDELCAVMASTIEIYTPLHLTAHGLLTGRLDSVERTSHATTRRFLARIVPAGRVYCIDRVSEDIYMHEKLTSMFVWIVRRFPELGQCPGSLHG